VSRVGGLVLAAGEGSRFGRPKALVEVAGETLLDRAVRVLIEGGCVQPVVAVVGATELPDRQPVDPAQRLVVNPDWRTGMASSLRVGLAACPEPAVVLMVVDTPGIGPEVVRRLVSAFEDGASVAVATYGGERRNPVLIARDHWAEVASLAVGDVGARPFLIAHPELVTAVECGDIGDPTDVDTPEDLARFAN